MAQEEKGLVYDLSKEDRELYERIRSSLPQDVRDLIHMFRNDLAKVYSKMQVHDGQIGSLNIKMETHNQICDEQKKQVSEALEILKGVKAFIKLANFVRNVVVGLAAVIVAVITVINHLNG